MCNDLLKVKQILSSDAGDIKKLLEYYKRVSLSFIDSHVCMYNYIYFYVSYTLMLVPKSHFFLGLKELMVQLQNFTARDYLLKNNCFDNKLITGVYIFPQKNILFPPFPPFLSFSPFSPFFPLFPPLLFSSLSSYFNGKCISLDNNYLQIRKKKWENIF